MKKLLLITEAGGAGVLSAIETICSHLVDEYKITFVYSRRNETPELAEMRSRFPHQIDLVPVDSGGWMGKARIFRLYRKMTHELEPDVVHLHSSIAGFVGRLSTMFARRKPRLFYSPHCFSFSRSDIGPLKRRLFYLLEKMGCLAGAEIIAVTRSEADQAKRIGASSVHVVYNSMLPEMDVSIAATKKRVLRIGMIGRITAQKDPFFFLNTASQVLKFTNRTAVEFIWVGGGEDRKMHEMVSRARALMIEDRVRITGWIPRAKVLDELKQMDIYLHTAEWEAHPIAILEAFSVGKPVVLRKYAGAEEIVEHDSNGYLCSSVDEAAFATLRLINDAEKRIELGRAGVERLRNVFDPIQQMNHLRNIYSGRSKPI